MTSTPLLMLFVALAASQGFLVWLVWRALRASKVPSPVSPPWPEHLRGSDGELEARIGAVETRMEQMEIRWQGVLEQLQERLEKGTQAWRRYNAAEAARRRKEEPEEYDDDEGEPENEAQGVLPLHGNGGDTRGMFTVPQSMDGAPEPPWRQFARAYAAEIAGRR